MERTNQRPKEQRLEREIYILPQDLAELGNFLKRRQHQVENLVNTYARWPLARQIAYQLLTTFTNPTDHEHITTRFLIKSEDEFFDGFARFKKKALGKIPQDKRALFVRWAHATAAFGLNTVLVPIDSQPVVMATTRKLIREGGLTAAAMENVEIDRQWLDKFALEIAQGYRWAELRTRLKEYVESPKILQ